MDQIVTDEQPNITTPSLTTSTSSGYKSEEMESEGGEHPTCRKYVPSNGRDSSKAIGEHMSLTSNYFRGLYCAESHVSSGTISR